MRLLWTALRLTSIALLVGTLTQIDAIAQSSEPFSYQGDVLGVMTFEQFIARVNPQGISYSPEFWCSEPFKATRSCTAREVRTANYIFVDDRLASVELSFNDAIYLDGYLNGLIQKFGPPSETATTNYEKLFGITYSGRIWRWQNASGGITLEECGHDRDSARLSFYDAKLMAEFKARREYKAAL
jgi:hypothetical protein